MPIYILQNKEDIYMRSVNEIAESMLSPRILADNAAKAEGGSKGSGNPEYDPYSTYDALSTNFNPMNWSYTFPVVGEFGFGVSFGTGEYNQYTGTYGGGSQIDVGVGIVSVNPGGGKGINFDKKNFGIGVNVIYRF